MNQASELRKLFENRPQTNGDHITKGGGAAPAPSAAAGKPGKAMPVALFGGLRRGAGGPVGGGHKRTRSTSLPVPPEPAQETVPAWKRNLSGNAEPPHTQRPRCETSWVQPDKVSGPSATPATAPQPVAVAGVAARFSAVATASKAATSAEDKKAVPPWAKSRKAAATTTASTANSTTASTAKEDSVPSWVKRRQDNASAGADADRKPKSAAAPAPAPALAVAKRVASPFSAPFGRSKTDDEGSSSSGSSSSAGGGTTFNKSKSDPPSWVKRKQEQQQHQQQQKPQADTTPAATTASRVATAPKAATAPVKKAAVSSTVPPWVKRREADAATTSPSTAKAAATVAAASATPSAAPDPATPTPGPAASDEPEERFLAPWAKKRRNKPEDAATAAAAPSAPIAAAATTTATTTTSAATSPPPATTTIAAALKKLSSANDVPKPRAEQPRAAMPPTVSSTPPQAEKEADAMPAKPAGPKVPKWKQRIIKQQEQEAAARAKAKAAAAKAQAEQEQAKEQASSSPTPSAAPAEEAEPSNPAVSRISVANNPWKRAQSAPTSPATARKASGATAAPTSPGRAVEALVSPVMRRKFPTPPPVKPRSASPRSRSSAPEAGAPAKGGMANRWLRNVSGASATSSESESVPSSPNPLVAISSLEDIKVGSGTSSRSSTPPPVAMRTRTGPSKGRPAPIRLARGSATAAESNTDGAEVLLPAKDAELAASPDRSLPRTSYFGFACPSLGSADDLGLGDDAESLGDFDDLSVEHFEATPASLPLPKLKLHKLVGLPPGRHRSDVANRRNRVKRRRPTRWQGKAQA